MIGDWRRGQYQMQNQRLFRYAPITKAWLCGTLFFSVVYMYLSADELGPQLAPSLANITSITGIFLIILSKLIFHNPSSLISGIVLLYYGRWVERRFGSRRFMNFVLLNLLQSFGIEIAIYFIIAQFYGYNPATMYFVSGPYSLLTALYLTYVKELPLVPYANIFGLSLSAHSLPLIMSLQLFELSKPVMIACAAGALSVLLYGQLSRKLNLLPTFFVNLFCSTSNPIGWLAQKFANCGEFGTEGKILPVAATVEQQRIEFIDNYERRLMFGQMQRIYRNERANSSDNQLQFLNRLLGRSSTGNVPSEDQVRQLVDMGLGSRQDVREALQQCDNDASEAANLLLHNRRKMSISGKRKFSDHVDCDYAKRGVWLVKVPRYLSEMWERNGGHDVGRLVIKPANGKTDLIFKSNISLLRTDSSGHDGETPPPSMLLNSQSSATLSSRVAAAKVEQTGFAMPTEHSFVIGDIRNQSLSVLCEDKNGLNEDADISSGRLSIEGRVVKRADCRPPQTADYMRMKIKQIEKSSQPKRHVKQMEKAEVKFKPIAVHAEMLAREKQKKEGAKTVRADKDIVRQAIFHAFEKHQYYRLIDLQKLTNQPPGFVKEILTEIAVYNTMPPHKSMWELKPEYRSYGSDKKEAE